MEELGNFSQDKLRVISVVTCLVQLREGAGLWSFTSAWKSFLSGCTPEWSRTFNSQHLNSLLQNPGECHPQPGWLSPFPPRLLCRNNTASSYPFFPASLPPSLLFPRFLITPGESNDISRLMCNFILSSLKILLCTRKISFPLTISTFSEIMFRH